MENKNYLAEREGEANPKEGVAFAVMTPEEIQTKTRILDKLDQIDKVPEKPIVIIPEVPPESYFRKDGNK